MQYSQFTLNDFLLDDFFIQWVKSPDPQTNLFWEGWLAEHPEKKALVTEARQLVLDLSTTQGKQLNEQDKRQLWNTINQRRTAAKSPRESRSKTPASRPILIEWIYKGRIAASVTAILMVAAWLIYINTNRHPPLVQFSTQYSEIKQVALPDGSQVTLNANSTLRYPSDWTDQQDREVQLTGEAFFDVVKKPGKANAKFIVHSQGLDIEVLGTQFNVNNRRNRVEVVLQEGKVGLSQAGSKDSLVVTMVPGDYIAYSEQDNRMLRKKVNPLLYSSWKEEETIFEEKPLYEIAQVLEDTKGLRMVFPNDSLKTLPFTGTLPNNDIDNFLMVLSKSFRIEVSRKGNQIMLQNE
jgi:ferric-dicitrate binding protein FerR (iron transport regulator)